MKFRREWLLSNLAIPFLLLLILFFVLGDIVGKPNRLPGTDSYWHVTLIDEAYDRFTAGESIGPIAESINAGYPFIFDTDSSYPQFAYMTSLIVSILTGNAGITFGLMMFMASAISQLTFYFGFRSRFGHIGTAIGAIAFAYAPFTLTNIAPQGRFPALLAVATLPAVMAGLLFVMDRPSRSRWILTTLAVGSAVAFHAMVFYIAAIPIALMAGLYALVNRISVSRIMLAASTTVAGVLIVWIFLPDAIADFTLRGGVAGLTAEAEGPGVRASTGAANKILPFSIRWNSFDVSLRLSNENYAGIGIVVASAIAATLSNSRKVLIFCLGTALAYLLTTGSLTPLWTKIPLAAQLEPRRFLFPAYLGAAIIIAAGSGRMVQALYEDRTAKSLAIFLVPLIAIIGLIAYDAIPMIRRIAPDDGYEKAWTQSLDKVDIDGRLFWNSHRDFSPYYFVGRESSIETVGRVGVVDASVRDGFIDRALAELALYNTRAVITDSVEFAPLVAALEDEGFEQLGKWDTQVLLASEDSGSPFMNQTRDVGLFGVAAREYWARILPNSITIANPADITPEYLASFRVVVLSGYDISNTDKAESALQTFIENGGLVIFEEPNRGGKNLFGVEHILKDVPPEFVVNGADGPREIKPFRIGSGRFTGAFYDDAGDIVLSGTSAEGEEIPLVQKKDLGLGAMYWVCCNVGNHTVVNPGRDLALADEVNKYFDSEVGGFRSVWPTELEEEITQIGPSSFQISYSSETPIPVLISYAARYKRTLTDEDGNRIWFTPAGAVGAAVLPAGDHVITLGTESNPFNKVVTFIWFIGLATAAFVLTLGWRLFSANGPSTEELALIGLRKYLTPKWVGEIPVANGTLKIQPPRLETEFEALSTESAFIQKFSPAHPDSRLAIINIEIANNSELPLELETTEIAIHLANGQTVNPATDDQLTKSESAKNDLLSSFDRRLARFDKTVSLKQGETASGFMMYSIESTAEIESLFISSDPTQRITIQ
ncbi:hypothetical protein GKN94_03825 [Candidatus Lucifugimonas marina]|uniref:6-pyruvoyl-tetrahydropterin synthase-related protein n=1 Tax=Candidatus Lucifugimonas marina TaxID=3038979 RepID=UPI0027A8B1D8|nr:hypothetical protein GKN94_03825 [SAR202 cluster bacterium JH545]